MGLEVLGEHGLRIGQGVPAAAGLQAATTTPRSNQAVAG